MRSPKSSGPGTRNSQDLKTRGSLQESSRQDGRRRLPNGQTLLPSSGSYYASTTRPNPSHFNNSSANHPFGSAQLPGIEILNLPEPVPWWLLPLRSSFDLDPFIPAKFRHYEQQEHNGELKYEDWRGSVQIQTRTGMSPLVAALKDVIQKHHCELNNKNQIERGGDTIIVESVYVMWAGDDGSEVAMTSLMGTGKNELAYFLRMMSERKWIDWLAVTYRQVRRKS